VTQPRASRRWLRRLGVAASALVASLLVWILAGAVVYSPQYVWRVLSWGQSDVGNYLDGFPLRPLSASPEPFQFALELQEDAVRSTFQQALGVEDLDAFLAETQTQALIVIKDDTIRYEGYFNGTQRDSMLTSFSVAKSFVSTLVGIALAEGAIGAVTDPVTDYLPELSVRDARFAEITIRDLLSMASGMDYQELRWWLFNGDDPLTTYFPDQREISLTNTTIIDQPGAYFRYNKYHPQLLGMILERTTGMSVTEYTQTRLWDPLGMEYSGAWALDSEDSGFEKMEAGLNARAIDYAKLGRLVLQQGRWDGQQVVPAEWFVEATALDPATQNADYYRESFGQQIYDDGRGYYRYMWYGKLRDGQPADIIAEGDRGQLIYISPAHNAIVVRNGFDFGIPMSEWTAAIYDAVDDL
jgi:CubicO group peptidase (beta-lactamase class C family)